MPCAAMAMQLKPLMSCVLLIFTLWTCPHLSVGKPAYTDVVWGPSCGNVGYPSDSLFQSNLNTVLESLVANVSMSGFNTSSVQGQNSNSTVYGLLQCTGDLSSTECQQCASAAKASLFENCQNYTYGFMQLNGCFLRYDNHSFYDYSETHKIYGTCGLTTGDPTQQFAQNIVYVLSAISGRAVQNPKYFAVDVFEVGSWPSKQIYSLAQCWRELSPASCQSCLTAGWSNITAGQPNIPRCGGRSNITAIGAKFHTIGCNLRYGIYDFYPLQSSPLSGILPLPPGESPLQSSPLSEHKKANVLAITLGIVAGAVGLIAGAMGLIHGYCFCLKRDDEEISLLPTIANLGLIFKYETLREATSNFKPENKLGQGGFGSVFKGVLPDYGEVAVKRLKIGSGQGDNEFLNEANLISRVQHKNLVKLLGYSVENSERLLVYEYLQNSSLEKIIFDTTKRSLDWRKRYEIIVGTARGLAYLHDESGIRIIHRDIKPSNILLDNKYRPKIADFGLAKLFAEDKSHLSTGAAGTPGYIAPESFHGHVTEKADVFSFGVLVLEIISGRKNYGFSQHTEVLIDATWRLYNAERAIEIMDPRLNGSDSSEEGIRVIKIGLLCTEEDPALRPTMSRVVSMLTSQEEHIPSPTKPYLGNYERTPSNIHSAAADSSSGIMERR